jgi:2,4-dienoyl-CoA reductase-like NADH-dependent reductase (Old Yellow Enzyme family)/thioredoxin reductase/acetoacetate decarboxylase
MLRQLSMTHDRNIAQMGKLTAAVHRHGTKIFCQLHHPGRQTMSALIGGQPVVSASAIPCKFEKQKTRALTTEEVKSLVQDFVSAAVRAQKSGFDGVELHGAHGYLIGQFFSPYTNKRTDAYGGNFENRMRFAVEIIRGIHATCGEDFPVSVRISVDEFLDKTGVSEDYIHVKDGVAIAMALEKAGAAAINVSCGIYETGVAIIEPVTYPQGWRTPFIKAVKDHVSVPVIAVNAIKEPQVAEKLLEDGTQDFIALGRAWLADPQWGLKAFEGRDKEIRKCIGCLNCFFSLKSCAPVCMPPHCSVNPRLCKESWYPELPYDAQHHKVVIIGAGPAGLSAARTAALRGMQVTLLEKEDHLGGLVPVAAAAPLKGNTKFLTDWYEEELSRLGVDVRLGIEATETVIKGLAPDAIIVATGAGPIVPGKIPGIDKAHVYTFNDVLNGTSGLSGKKVAVIGAGIVGLECGEYLNEKDCTVTIIDMLDAVAPSGNQTIVLDDCMHLKAKGTNFLLGHALKEIKDGSVVLTRTSTKENVEVPCDAVVLCLGLKPERTLAAKLEEHFVNVYEVGACVDAGGNFPGATNAAYDLVYHLFEKKPETSFHLDAAGVKKFSPVSVMREQEGVYMSYLTKPEAISRILPPPLKPFSLPVVTLSVCHIADPSFADNYYEAILGVYAYLGDKLGLYPISLVLGGQGAEMAVAAGRDNGSMPKKLGAEFVIRKEGDNVHATVVRRGTQLVDLELEIGAYNSPLTALLYQSPEPGKKTYGGGFYYHFDRLPDEKGVSRFQHAALLTNLCEYDYKLWKPGFAKLKLQSSLDDPWAELPITTIVGGAYSKNDLTVQKETKVMDLEADKVMPYLLTGYYDQTLFGRTGRK